MFLVYEWVSNCYNTFYFYFSVMAFAFESRFGNKKTNNKNSNHNIASDDPVEHLPSVSIKPQNIPLGMIRGMEAVRHQTQSDLSTVNMEPMMEDLPPLAPPTAPAIVQEAIQGGEKHQRKRGPEKSPDRPKKFKALDQYRDVALKKGRSNRSVNDLVNNLRRCVNATEEDVTNLLLSLTRYEEEIELKAREEYLSRIVQDLTSVKQELQQCGALIAGQSNAINSMSQQMSDLTDKTSSGNKEGPKRQAAYVKAFVNVLQLTGKNTEAELLNRQMSVILAKNPSFPDIYNVVINMLLNKH